MKSSRVTFRDRVAAFLQAHPNEWIPARKFEPVGGRQAWRTRISDCRVELGMTIDNRVRRIRMEDGGYYTLSEYRYRPPVEQGALFGPCDDVTVTT